MADEPELTRVEITDDELTMLFYGLVDLGGPAQPTEAMAVALGFASVEDLDEQGFRLANAIAAGHALSARDWTRALACAEITFASEVFGDGDEWTVIHAGRDHLWIDVLRRLQSKVPWSRRHLGP